ncbi:MAG: S8 family serine peptidase, partial [Candidatus Zixiibacteriota bacterium]
MKGFIMRHAMLTLLILALATSIHAAKHPLKIAPKNPKIAERFQQKLDSAQPEAKFKVWIFFTDKEISDESSLKKAVRGLPRRFTEKSAARRAARTNIEEGFDFYDVPVSETYIRQVETTGAEIVHRSRWLNGVSAYADVKTIAAVSELPFVAEIRPVATARRKPLPDDTDLHKIIPPELHKVLDTLPDSIKDGYGISFTQLQLINVPLMHLLGYTGEGILIAIFDTGYDIDHPVFGSLNLIDKYDFINKDTSVGDALNDPRQPSHGTATLSVVGGREDAVLIGSAYDAGFLLGKTEIIDEEIQAEEDNWVAASEWADSLGADVITSSVGYYVWYDPSVLDGQTAIITIAAEVAASRGIVPVNSAGNERLGDWHYVIPPADGPSVIAVGAVNSEGEIASFSSVGPTTDGRIKPDVVAMGVSVYAADYFTGDYKFAGGTSYSAPLTAGAAALVLQANPGRAPPELKEMMLKSADRYDNPDNEYGYGLFDTFKAADLFRIDPIDPIVLIVGDSLDISITVSGLEDSTDVTITAENLPPTAVLTSTGGRSERLRY